MDYRKIYRSLCDKTKNNIDKGYCETHHIIPKCIGGGDDECNLIKFSARKHYIAHLLLTKIYPNNIKLCYALNRMSTGNYNNGERYYSSIFYSIARTKLSEYMKSTYLIYDKNGNCFRCDKNDIKLLTGEYVHIMTIKSDAHLRRTINNGIINKKVLIQDLDYYLDNGWILGENGNIRHNYVLGKVKVYNNNGCKAIYPKEVNEYLNNGWILGKGYSSTENTKWINKDNVNKMISYDILQQYLDDGWKLGTGDTKYKRQKYCYINKDNIEKRIPLKELEIYIKSSWVRGRLCKPGLGLIHINNGIDIKHIKKDEYDKYVLLGWKRGDFKNIKNKNNASI